MKNLLRLCLFSLLLMQSCGESVWLSGTIKGHDDNAWKPKVYLVQPDKYMDVAQSFVGKVLDSAELDKNGYFQFKDAPDFQEHTLLMLVVQPQNEKYANRLVNTNPQTDNYFPFVYESGSKLFVEAEMSKFQSTLRFRDPSVANQRMEQLRDLKLSAYTKYLEDDSKNWGTDKDLLDREKRLYNFQKELIGFSDSTEELLPALMALRWASPEGDYERTAELVYAQSNKWSKVVPGHKWVKELTQIADKSNLPILVNDTIPSLVFPMKDGSETSISDVTTGKKLVLLDVWASWCAPCRVENRNVLVPLWEKYGDKGFQIMAYALESSKKAWNNAIERDGAHRWLHASHLQGDQNPFMDALRLKTIPANFLLDSEGKVLAKNLHGEELMKFVDDFMRDN